MDKDKLKSQLVSEGFPSIYEWIDKPGTKYDSHSHKGKVSLLIVSGSVAFSDGFEKVLKEGDRFDVPAGVSHSAIVGPEGCEYIVGEEIEGDS